MDLIKDGEIPGTSFYRLEGEIPIRSGRLHFHIRAHGVHGCVTGIEGRDDAEAEGNALDEFFTECFQSDNLADVFGNRDMTYCAERDCGGCDLEVHVIRMQDGRQAIEPRVLVFDLI